MSAPLWTPSELAGATRGRWLRKPPKNWAPRVVSYNLLTSQAQGHVIVCMTPDSWAKQRPDTSQRLADWHKGGCVGAIIQPGQQRGLPPLPKSFPLLLVPDTRQALSALGRAARERFTGQVVALSATVGKTTTREILGHILAPFGGVTRSLGNNNNIPGAERTMASTPADGGYCVIEMGFGNPRDGIAVSARRTRPHVALLGRVDLGHLDVFSREEQRACPGTELVALAKSRMFDALEGGEDERGTCVVLRDQPVFPLIEERAEGRCLVSYGRDPSADLRIVGERSDARGSRVRCRHGEREFEFQLGIVGRHMVENAVGALATAHALGIDPEQAAASLAEFRSVGGRAQIKTIRVGEAEVTLIDDSFNATPASVRSTLDLLRLVPPTGEGRRIAVLGDILHLGPGSASLHASLSTAIGNLDTEETGLAHVFTIGDEMRHLHEALPSAMSSHIGSLSELYASLRAYLREGDVLTLKASTRIGLQKIAEALRGDKAQL